jgi:hypothetical protein
VDLERQYCLALENGTEIGPASCKRSAERQQQPADSSPVHRRRDDASRMPALWWRREPLSSVDPSPSTINSMAVPSMPQGEPHRGVTG